MKAISKGTEEKKKEREKSNKQKKKALFNTITFIDFMVTPCINNIHRFIFQVMHTMLKNVELLKHFKIRKLPQHVSVYKETIREPQPVLS